MLYCDVTIKFTTEAREMNELVPDRLLFLLRTKKFGLVSRFTKRTLLRERLAKYSVMH